MVHMIIVYIGIVLIIIAVCILYIKIKAISEVLAAYVAKYNNTITPVCIGVKDANEKLNSIREKHIILHNIACKTYAHINTIDSTIDKAITKSMNENKAKISSNNNKPANTLTPKHKAFKKLKTANK